MKAGQAEAALTLLEEGLAYAQEQAKAYNIQTTVRPPLLLGGHFTFGGTEYHRALKEEFESLRSHFAPLEGHPRYRSFLARLEKSAE